MHVSTVHFCGGDDIGWALDEDLRLLRDALAGECAPAPLFRAEVVHAVWWVRLLPFSRRDLRGKHVLCYADNAPFHYATDPEFLRARERVTLWIARSREAVSQFTALGLESRFAPYTIDPSIFHPLPAEDPGVRALAEKWRIPTDRYLIANFHRDTESSDLQSPKLQKGPDAFVEIVSRLCEEGAPVHVLLAGPRRFYLRRTLAERGVPFTFLGQETAGRDDIGVNVLPRATLNLLYNTADVHLISSRWEGGPHSVLESAATRCKVVSTPVGIAPDILAPDCLFSDIPEACEILRRDIRDNFLAPSTDALFAHARNHHSKEALSRHLVEIYGSLPAVRKPPSGILKTLDASFRRLAHGVSSRFRRPAKPLCIAILHRAVSESQTCPTGLTIPTDAAAFPEAFFEELSAALEKEGHTVLHNKLCPALDGVLLGKIAQDDPLLAALNQRKDVPVIGFFDETASSTEDALSAQMANRAASDTCTVLPSLDALDALRKQGLLPRRALVLPPLAEAQSGESSEPLVVEPEDDWAAHRIQAALACGRPVLFPAASHYRYLVWFGGAAYAGPDDARQKLDSLRANCSIFARMTLNTGSPQAADRILRLLRVCRDLMADED